MTKEEEFFSSIFDTNPNIAILNINNNCSDITEQLENIVKNLSGKLTTKEFGSMDERKFRLTAREYEYAVVCDCLHELEKQDRFIKEVYHSLENSANIILISKKENMDQYTMMELLDKK